MFTKRLMVWLLLGLIADVPFLFSQEPNNLALGRTYLMDPAPDHKGCTDQGDKTQLTDGEKKGAFWGGVSTTVGWSKNVNVTIDLGWERKFNEVKIFSRANSYGIGLTGVEVLVSPDGKEYRSAGAFKQNSGWPVGDYAGESQVVSVITTSGAQGRFVKISMLGYLFIDEIEVLSASPKLLALKTKTHNPDGSYTYTLNYTLPSESPKGEVRLEGCTPWGEILFAGPVKVNQEKGTAVFSFSLPSELSNCLWFSLRDEKDTVVEKMLERVSYELPASQIKPVQIIPLEKDWSCAVSDPDKSPLPEAWKNIDIQNGFYQFAPFYAQANPRVVWYKNKFFLPRLEKSAVTLYLGRIRHAPTIYLNGNLVSEKDLEPNLPHRVDLTKFIKEGENELVIKVYDWRALLVKGAGPKALEKYREDKQELWFGMAPAVKDSEVANGTFSFIYPPGDDMQRYGILDRVELQVSPLVQLGDIRVTPSVSRKSISLVITLKNRDERERRVVITNVIGDVKKVNTRELPETTITIPALTEKTVTVEAAWENPELWWPRRPHLYHLCTTVKENNEIVETKDTRFGFREILTRGDTVTLNGKKLHLFGVHNRDNFGIGSYATLRWLRGYSFNTWRTLFGTSGEGLQKAADEMGFFIIDEGNFFARYVNASQTFWDNCFSHFQRRAQRDYNHPSVIAYSTQNEYTPYSTFWSPADWTKQRMDELIQRMEKEDPTRLCGHEGSFEVGSLSGSENALFSHYGAEATISQKEDVQERLLPNYYYSWVESFQGTAWEKKPVYLGEMGLAWDFRSNIPDASTIYNMGDKIYRDWRVPEQVFDARTTIQYLPMETEALRYKQTLGLSPNTWGNRPEISELCATYFSPFFIQVKEYSHNFYGGDKVKRHVILYNDYLDGKGEKNLVFSYELKDGAKIVDRGEKEVLVEDGEKKELDIYVNAPEVKERRAVQLSLRLLYEGKAVFETEKSYAILPPIRALTSNKQILLYDKKGETGSFLKKVSVNYATADFARLNPEKDILIVGADSLDEGIVEHKDQLKDFVKKGGVVISLEQKNSSQWLPVPLALDTSFPSTINYLRATGHPLLVGIEEDDLKFWGEDNITARSNFKKPVLGGYRAIADTAGLKGLLWSPLLEIPYYRGTYVLCQFDLLGKFFSEPAAGLLFRNMLDYANRKREAPSKLAVLKETGEKLKNSLRSAGIAFDELNNVPETPASGYNLLLLDGSLKLGPADETRLKKFAGEGGRVILHNLSPASSLTSLLPEPVSLRSVQIDQPGKSVIHTEYTPVTYGMSNQIFYWLGKPPTGGGVPWPPSPEIADFRVETGKGSQAETLLDPPLLVKFNLNKGYFLIDQINWEKAQGTSQKKAEEYLRILFTNLGVAVEVKGIQERATFPIDISSFCNMGFADEKPEDGKGGWTDQGPDNDLRAIPLGEVKLKGVSFTVIDPVKNNGKSCIVLKGEHSPWGIEKIAGIKVGRLTPALYFLHASAWTTSAEMAKYIVNYSDGEQVAIPVIGGKNIGEWWRPVVDDLPEAEIAWEGPNPLAGNIGLWLFSWKNPKPEKEIRSIDIVSNNQKSIPGLVAVSGEKEKK